MTEEDYTLLADILHYTKPGKDIERLYFEPGHPRLSLWTDILIAFVKALKKNDPKFNGAKFASKAIGTKVITVE